MKSLFAFLAFTFLISAFAQYKVQRKLHDSHYQKSNFQITNSKNKFRCEGGGIDFRTPYFNYVSYYKNFEKQYPKCGSYQKKGIINPKVERIKARSLAERLAESKRCPEFNKISKTYLQKHEQTMKSLHKDKLRMNKMVSHEAQNTEVQVEASYLAWGYIICSTSHHSTELVDRLNYIKDIEEIKYETAPVVVASNGETVKDCHNVNANGGTEGLDEFYIDISGATAGSATMSYNTFMVPDNVIVESETGETLLESGCVGTNIDEVRVIPLDKSKYKKIKVKVDALCEGKKGSTAWNLHFSCGPRDDSNLPKEEKIRRRDCREIASQASNQLRDNVNNINFVIHSNWARAVCQKKHYGKIVGDYTKFNTLLSTQGNSNYARLNLDVDPNYKEPPTRLEMDGIENKAFAKASNLKSSIDLAIHKSKIGPVSIDNEEQKLIDIELKKTLAEINSMDPKTMKDYVPPKFDKSKKGIYELLGQDVPENEARSLANVAPVTRHEVTPFVYGYDDFIKRKTKYCPPEPKENDSLLERVSYAYCQHAYPRLFGVEDDD